jgi:hypothetical protein
MRPTVETALDHAWFKCGDLPKSMPLTALNSTPHFDRVLPAISQPLPQAAVARRRVLGPMDAKENQPMSINAPLMNQLNHALSPVTVLQKSAIKPLAVRSPLASKENLPSLPMPDHRMGLSSSAFRLVSSVLTAQTS